MWNRARSAKPCLLTVGVIQDGASFARVFRSLFRYLTDHYEIHHLGLDYKGCQTDVGWLLYPNRVPGDLLGLITLGQLVEEVRPDVILILNDLRKIPPYIETLKKIESSVPLVVNCPIDGEILNSSLVAFLSAANRFVVPTAGSIAMVENALSPIIGGMENGEKIRVMAIPYGVETETFFPIPDRSWVRRELWPDRPDLIDAFIILNANRNQPRKRLDLTLEGFAAFARDKPRNVKLLLHSDFGGLGCDLIALAREFAIEDRLLYIANPDGFLHVSNNVLNLIYNACNVGLNTSSGEGWGLVSFEHAATGAGQIVPDHSACAELWDGIADFIEPFETIRDNFAGLSQVNLSVTSVTESLEHVYSDLDHLEALSKRCYNHATRPKFSWQYVTEKWHTLFQHVING